MFMMMMTMIIQYVFMYGRPATPPLAVSEQTPHFRQSPASGEDEESAHILTAGEYARLQSNSPTDIRVNRPGVVCL